jgi:hypothetical protein
MNRSYQNIQVPKKMNQMKYRASFHLQERSMTELKNRKQISINRVENIWKQENNAGQLNTLEITCRNKNVLKIHVNFCKDILRLNEYSPVFQIKEENNQHQPASLAKKIIQPERALHRGILQGFLNFLEIDLFMGSNVRASRSTHGQAGPAHFMFPAGRNYHLKWW